MKTLEQIITQTPVYVHGWSTKLDIYNDFKDQYEDEESLFAANKKHQIKDWDKINILFASYGCANYSGDAWVLFEKDGELYEINGGHCSCYGLEGQWSPEKAILVELENRLIKGTLGSDDYSDNLFNKELAEFLGVTLPDSK